MESRLQSEVSNAGDSGTILGHLLLPEMREMQRTVDKLWERRAWVRFLFTQDVETGLRLSTVWPRVQSPCIPRATGYRDRKGKKKKKKAIQGPSRQRPTHFLSLFPPSTIFNLFSWLKHTFTAIIKPSSRTIYQFKVVSTLQSQATPLQFP